MTRGSKEVENIYKIKIGNMFIEKCDTHVVGEKRILSSYGLSSSRSRKWSFKESDDETSEDFQGKEHFLAVCNSLKEQDTSFKILKTTITTIEEEKEVSFVDGKESNLKGLSEGGLVGNTGKLAVLHNDFVLNKGDAEKLFQSAGESAALLSKSADEIAEAIQQVCKDALATQKKEEVNDVALAILKSLKKKGIY